MTYHEYTEKKQKEFNELPLFFAFSNEQFKEAMKQRGLTENDTDKIYRFGASAFYLKTDAPIIRAYVNRDDKTELEALMADKKFRVSAFRYEMDNHEYAINYYQGDWDVLNCFAYALIGHSLEYGEDKTYVEYLNDLHHAEWISDYQEARRSHMKAAEEWF